MQYKNAHKNAARIGSELGVDYIVAGGVSREKERVHQRSIDSRARPNARLGAELRAGP